MTADEQAIERLKLEIELEKTKADAAQRVADGQKQSFTFWTLVVTSVVGPLITLLGLYVNARYQIAATVKGEATTIAKAAEIKESQDVAAGKTEEVKVALDATTINRDKQLHVIYADVAATKAELTKDPDDMETAKIAKQKAEEHAAIPAAAMPK